MGTKNKPGVFDCYAEAKPDEPMFVLLARDPSAALLVRIWCQLRRARKGLTEADSKETEAEHCAVDMERWREDHKKTPDDPVQRGHGPGSIPKGAFADMGPATTEPPSGVLLSGAQPAELLKFLSGEKFDANVIAEIKRALEAFTGQ